ncbi:MAG: hypothetical protein P4L62_04055 [Candidatus Pacebacteria bacterium]|nr:hypothetical protein [Candidatus Paceibacterota bacterium]MDR3583504.1 hypothetical protein [Candidatus Paceibacterota bacterium]
MSIKKMIDKIKIKNKKQFIYKASILLIVLAGATSITLAASGKWNVQRAEAQKTKPQAAKNKKKKSNTSQTDSQPASSNGTAETNNAPGASAASQNDQTTSAETAIVANSYPLHANISTTYFWVGEPGDSDNKDISNTSSAWDDDWQAHFGGVDNPGKRNGYLPAGFTPKENPFYFALPYNDFDGNGNHRKNLASVVPWAAGEKYGSQDSVCKNQWIKITKGGKIAYAQWEDVGPFGENDSSYVFGSATPSSKTNSHAGLDVSPAVHDYLGLSDEDRTDWQFIPASQVPSGPWKQIITADQVYWN